MTKDYWNIQGKEFAVFNFGHKSKGSEVMKLQETVGILRIRNLLFLIALSKYTEILRNFSIKVTITQV